MSEDWHSLEKISIFDGLQDSELSEVFNLLEKENVPKGKTIVREGSEGDDVYIIVSGFATVFKKVKDKNVALCEVGPHDCFGEMALIEINTRSASVQANDDMVVLKLTHAALLKLRDVEAVAYGKIMYNIARIVAERLRSSIDKIKEVLWVVVSLS
ncbi:MAG: cyclic nucleotide-binding domain-containing protein [Bacteriovoracaceae bacterium]|nr:cyclic nucleotide-binding domain-containing protein [Bacteriovoracaceae bacterium]